jgi:hypothetical protein
LTQHRQYWPNSFHSTYKSLDNISMGEMIEGLMVYSEEGFWKAIGTTLYKS